jgi:hypothetical protein
LLGNSRALFGDALARSQESQCHDFGAVAIQLPSLCIIQFAPHGRVDQHPY